MDSIPQRVCAKCEIAFPETTEFFRKDPHSRGGLMAWCKNCARGYNREWDALHRPNRNRKQEFENPSEYLKNKHERTERKCNRCGIIKPLDQFSTAQCKSQGRSHRCRNCDRSVREYRRQKERIGADTRNSPGYIYVVYSIGRYKIGLSAFPQKRIRQIQSPYPVELICIIHTDDMLSIERRLHDRFDHARKHGEWFELSDKDVEEIKHMV